MNLTQNEWVKNPDGTQGYTWNPITGCLNHIKGLCKGGGFPCHAYRLANGRLRDRYLANGLVAYDYYGDEDAGQSEKELHTAFNDPFYPRFWSERLDELHSRNRAMRNTLFLPEKRGIFVCDMGELFGDWVPEIWTEEVLNAIDMNDNYDCFYLLTKQPQNLLKWSPFPPNCYVGVTATTDGMTTMALQYLSLIEAKVKYISFEPLLGSVGTDDPMGIKGIIDWIIIGAQTKPYKPPKVEWVQEIIEAADRAGVPVFLKDNLKPLMGDNLRQEMPRGGK